jgi:pimeloyl-ACP methyl ester carboxylesterase
MFNLFIKNRKGQNITVIVEKAEPQKGLAFVMHGLGGFKEQPHIQAMAEAFMENGYTVVRFDTTNSIGESDGKYEDATITNYYEDLEDVINWAQEQDWYQEPFILSGHSLGGICTALYAEKYPDKVKALAPISTVVSGKLSVEAHSKEEINDWEKSGWKIGESRAKPGVMKRLKWSHIIDRLQYDLLPEVDKLKMPALLIVGENDDVTPLKHQQDLFEALPGQKELHVIKGSWHTFREEKHLQELKNIFDQWLKKI